jgi:hypothetical protein
LRFGCSVGFGCGTCVRFLGACFCRRHSRSSLRFQQSTQFGQFINTIRVVVIGDGTLARALGESARSVIPSCEGNQEFHYQYRTSNVGVTLRHRLYAFAFQPLTTNVPPHNDDSLRRFRRVGCVDPWPVGA